MIRFTLILIGLLYLNSALSQEIEVESGDILFGGSTGFNYSKLDIEKDNLERATRPFFGLHSAYIYNNNWRLKGASYFSMKASRIASNASFQQIGVDLLLFPQYKWDDLYFNAGLAYDLPITSGIQYIGKSSTERNRVQNTESLVVTSQLNFLIGFELKLASNWKVESNFSIPTGASGSKNFMLGLSYQLNKRVPRKESERRIRKRVTTRQIKELRNGALLVRLKTSHMKIAAMRKMGFEYEAREEERNQRIENLSLMRAFKSYYNFSEVRFFMSNSSNKVREGDYEGIFVNDSLRIDSSIVLRNKKHIYTAEFAKLEEDTSRYFSHYERVQTGHFASILVPRFYGGGGNTFMALVIRDQDFEQLRRPFPYYSRALFKAMRENRGHGAFYFPVSLFSPMSYSNCVKNLNNKLFRYFNKVTE